MARKSTNLPTWLTSGCPSWCAYPERHADSDKYDDRIHDGITTEIILTAEESIRGHDGAVYDDPSQVDITMSQHYREASPRIWVGRNQTDEGVHLTLDEAERLARELLLRVAIVRDQVHAAL